MAWSSSDSAKATPPWLELPREMTTTIIQKLGAVEILTTAEKVCTYWRSLCQESSMWESIDMRIEGNIWEVPYDLEKLCRYAVDRSQGQLKDINIEYFGSDELLLYISQRCPQLRRLRLVLCDCITSEGVAEAVQNLPLLEELHLYYTNINNEAIEAVGRCCPHLKSFKLNLHGSHIVRDLQALAVAKTMPELCHLQLLGNEMSNKGLQAILDGCPHLESLDLRRCFNVHLEGNLEKLCCERIKYLRHPNDSTDDYEFDAVIRDEEDSERIDLPSDVTANILHRLGAIEILEIAQKVCTTWRSVCEDPAMWRVIEMKYLDGPVWPYDLNLMCRHAVDRSKGQLIDIHIEYLGDDQLMHHISQRSSHLRRLTLACCYDLSSNALIEGLKRFPELEELHLIIMPSVLSGDIETIGIACPKLNSFTFNERGCMYPLSEGSELDEFADEAEDNECAVAVAKTMPNLRHLRLFQNEMKNEGLQAILDGCPHLESLDLRQCYGIDLGGVLGKRCCQQIKHLKLPSDSVADYEWDAGDTCEERKATHRGVLISTLGDILTTTLTFSTAITFPMSEIWFLGHGYL
ncbi:putative F-box/LRR-repeat protein 23 [Sesamum alatum]|uniref:F-box/LRR-repeat protein 23 n=1 Tax=Sesamum alatum TaxID=300844 RepID=A0AAE2CZK4_9LAMI|nr:putative F-box/LRR-repeat protein 23 [Sesamum alatum]